MSTSAYIELHLDEVHLNGLHIAAIESVADFDSEIQLDHNELLDRFHVSALIVLQVQRIENLLVVLQEDFSEFVVVCNLARNNSEVLVSVRHTELPQREISHLLHGEICFGGDSETHLVEEKDAYGEEIVFDNRFAFPVTRENLTRFHAD